MNDARLCHPWLRINRVLRMMLHTRWDAEAWSVVRVEFRRAPALRSETWRAEMVQRGSVSVNLSVAPRLHAHDVEASAVGFGLVFCSEHQSWAHRSGAARPPRGAALLDTLVVVALELLFVSTAPYDRLRRAPHQEAGGKSSQANGTQPRWKEHSHTSSPAIFAFSRTQSGMPCMFRAVPDNAALDRW